MNFSWEDFVTFLNGIDDGTIDKICKIPEELKEDIIKKAEVLSKKRSVIEDLTTFIDLTTLQGDDTKSRIDDLVNSAINPIKDNPQIKCASVCVYPAKVLDACNAIKTKGSSISVASVACGFPSGQYHIESRLLEIQLAIRDGATEIDAVINRSAVLECDWQLLFEELKKIRLASVAAKLKIILSVGELGSNKAIYLTSMLAMFAGADFIKTSTGKEAINATLESAYIMCLAISEFEKMSGKLIGFKAAGGIRSVEQAFQYLCLVDKVSGGYHLKPECFRIGASIGLLENIRKRLEEI